MWQKDTILESFVHAMFEMKSHYRFTFWYGSSYDKNNNLKAIIKTYCDKQTEMFLETFNNELPSNFGAWNNFLFLMKQKIAVIPEKLQQIPFTKSSEM